jgi:hypothetical protein
MLAMNHTSIFVLPVIPHVGSPSISALTENPNLAFAYPYDSVKINRTIENNSAKLRFFPMMV